AIATPNAQGTPFLVVTYDFEIVYIPQGFTVFTLGSGKPSISNDMRLSGPVFFAPSKEGYAAALETKAQHLDLLVPWQGIKDFDFYCRDPYPNHKTCD